MGRWSPTVLNWKNSMFKSCVLMGVHLVGLGWTVNRLNRYRGKLSGFLKQPRPRKRPVPKEVSSHFLPSSVHWGMNCCIAGRQYSSIFFFIFFCLLFFYYCYFFSPIDIILYFFFVFLIFIFFLSFKYLQKQRATIFSFFMLFLSFPLLFFPRLSRPWRLIYF